MYKEKYFVNDKEYSVTAKHDGTEIKAEGIEALVADYKDAVKATKAAETALATLKSEVDTVRKGYIADCENFGKLINEPQKADELEKLGLKELKAKADEIRAKHDAPAKVEKAAPTASNEPKGFFTK